MPREEPAVSYQILGNCSPICIAIEFEAIAMRAPIGFSGRYVNSLTSDDDTTMQLAFDNPWPRMLQDLAQDLAQGRDRRSIVLTRRLVPPNNGGLALGQVMVVAMAARS